MSEITYTVESWAELYKNFGTYIPVNYIQVTRDNYRELIQDDEVLKEIETFFIKHKRASNCFIGKFLVIDGKLIPATKTNLKNYETEIIEDLDHDKSELLETRRGQTSLKLVMVEVAKNLYPDIDFSQPDTWCIHHVDGNDKNNDMTNISLMKRGKHTSLHSAIRYKKLEKIKDLKKSILYIGRDLIDKVNLEGTENEEKLLNDSYIKIKRALIEYNNSELLKEEVMLNTDNQNKLKSNGIYSVLDNKWIKEPVQSNIPDIDQEEFEKLFTEWEDKYFELLDSINKEGLQEKMVVKDPRNKRKKIIVPETIESVVNSPEFKNIYSVCNEYSKKNGLLGSVEQSYVPSQRNEPDTLSYYWTWDFDERFPTEDSIDEFYKKLGINDYDIKIEGKHIVTHKDLKINGCTVQIKISEDSRIYNVSIYNDAIEIIEKYK